MFSARTFTGVTTADRMRPRPDGCGSRLQALPLYHFTGDGHGMQNPSLIRNARRIRDLRSRNHTRDLIHPLFAIKPFDPRDSMAVCLMFADLELCIT